MCPSSNVNIYVSGYLDDYFSSCGSVNTLVLNFAEHEEPGPEMVRVRDHEPSSAYLSPGFVKPFNLISENMSA